MKKRVVVMDVLIGVGLAVLGQLVQMGADLAGRAIGLPYPYEMAPEDGSIPPDLLNQISLTFALAAVGMVVLTFAIGIAVRVKGAAVGAQRGVVWAAVVALSQVLLGLAEGVVPVFGLVGTWIYLAAVVLGPVLAGVLGSRRPAPELLAR